MDAFDTTSSGGVWTLNVVDDSSICTGTLNAWSLTLDGAPPLPVELMTLEIS
jgi:subtilisin-like proprotein convertase family protein